MRQHAPFRAGGYAETLKRIPNAEDDVYWVCAGKRGLKRKLVQDKPLIHYLLCGWIDVPAGGIIGFYGKIEAEYEERKVEAQANAGTYGNLLVERTWPEDGVGVISRIAQQPHVSRINEEGSIYIGDKAEQPGTKFSRAFEQHIARLFEPVVKLPALIIGQDRYRRSVCQRP